MDEALNEEYEGLNQLGKGAKQEKDSGRVNVLSVGSGVISQESVREKEKVREKWYRNK